MSSPTTSTSTTTPAAAPSGDSAATTGTSGGAVSRAGAGPLGSETGQGRTTIADAVVSKVAGLAAREIPGVYGFGGGAARAFGAITSRIQGGRASSTQGVSVEVGERQAAVDLTVVVEYGVAIAELSRAIRRNVIGAIEQMTGLEVVEVNINVVDLHMPSDDRDEQDDRSEQQPARSTSRVQ